MFLSKSVLLVPELVGTELLWEERSRSRNFFPGAGAEETLFGSVKLKKIFLLKSDSIIGKLLYQRVWMDLFLRSPGDQPTRGRPTLGDQPAHRDQPTRGDQPTPVVGQPEQQQCNALPG